MFILFYNCQAQYNLKSRLPISHVLQNAMNNNNNNNNKSISRPIDLCLYMYSRYESLFAFKKPNNLIKCNVIIALS